MKYLDQPTWKGNWYIYDRGLFVNDLLEVYHKKTNLTLEKLSDQEDQADWIFVQVFQSLISGKLKTWLDIEKVDL